MKGYSCSFLLLNVFTHNLSNVDKKNNTQGVLQVQYHLDILWLDLFMIVIPLPNNTEYFLWFLWVVKMCFPILERKQKAALLKNIKPCLVLYHWKDLFNRKMIMLKKVSTTFLAKIAVNQISPVVKLCHLGQGWRTHL